MDDGPEMILLDVTPHTLGIMVVGGYFEALIPQNSTVPTSRSKTFTTVRDNQTSVKILVLQGEQEDDLGCYESGTCIVNEPGSRHAVHSKNGCVVLVIWNRPVRFCAETPT